jgi:putative membrane protein
MQGDDGMMMGGGILAGFVLLVVFVLVVIGIVVAIVWLARQNAGSPMNKTTYSSHTSQNDALDILKRRYASGEITKDQYEEMKKDIGQ